MMANDVANSLQKGKRRSLNRGKTKSLFNKQNDQQDHRFKEEKSDMLKSIRCVYKSHSKAQKCPAIKAKCFGCKKIVHYKHMCFKTVMANCNSLECEDSDSDNQDIDDRIFLGTLS